MVWSYSRIKCFDDCAYRFFLKYIHRLSGKDMFFSSYGSFMHKLIEQFLKGEKSRQQLINTYLTDFKNEVVGWAPNKKIFTNYFTGGLSYLKTIELPQYNVLAVEKRVDFDINGVPFVGYIDILGEQDGELYVIDNKSRSLKPRSTRKLPTKTDAELDDYLKQLYLYSAAVEREYERLPSSLCFNCFRVPIFIKEPFQQEAYLDAKNWLLDKVFEITQETEFNPSIEFFKCKHLCEMQDHCCFYQMNFKK